MSGPGRSVRPVRPGRHAGVRVPRPRPTPPRVRRQLADAPVVLVLVAVLVLGVLLVGRLGTLQLAEHEELAARADQAATREISVPALRGRILAADGTPIAVNTPTSVVTVEPAELLDAEDEGRALVEDVATALDLPVDQLWGRTRLCGTADAPPPPACFSGSPYEPVPIAFDVDPVDALAVLERLEDFPGVAVSTEPVRSYPGPSGINAAHLLGYLGRPTQEEVDGADGELVAEDRLGRAGLEQAWDRSLRGTHGTTRVAVDPRGVVVDQLSRTEPRRGQDVRTHLDVRIQAATEEALADAVEASREEGLDAPGAAAVVLDPRDGAVVAMASYPTYDPEIWTRGVSQREYDDLRDPEQGSALVNKAVAETYPPASTFKVVSLVGALQTGIDPEARYDCPGVVRIAGQEFTNFESQEHGSVTLPEAIAVSCDTTFYRWAFDHWQDLGGVGHETDDGDRFLAAAQGFGLGRRTGVDLPAESAGTLPSRAWKREYWEATREEACARAEEGYPEVEDEERREFLEQLAQENCTEGWQWRPGDAVNFSIGQGDVATTPLQMAVVYAALANGGRLWEPQVADAVLDADGSVLRDIAPEAAGTVPLTDTALGILREGLDDVLVEDGTAAAAFAGWPQDYPLAGKTGSAEQFGRDATSWFVSYGPTDEPRYVVAMVIDQGGYGGEAAAPAVRRIWEVVREVDGA